MPFAVQDGVRLHWKLDGAPGHPAIMLLHPGEADLTIWDVMVPKLVDQFQILRADLRGRGLSDASEEFCTAAELASNMLAVMDAAGMPRVCVAGVGLGGRIAIELALLAPQRVQALALICTSLQTTPEFGAHATEAVHDVARAERLAQIVCPTLVVGGLKDTIAPFETYGAVVANVIVGAQTIMMDCGHFPPSESPDALANLLQLFFLKPSTVVAAEELLYRSGMVNRRRVLGDVYVDSTLTRRTPFNAEFQEMITRIAWHEIYSRDGLDLRTRRLIVLAVTAATARWEEFRLHLRAAITTGGVPRDDIKELLMQLAIYAGVPAANTGFAEAAEIFAALDRENR